MSFLTAAKFAALFFSKFLLRNKFSLFSMLAVDVLS